MPSPFLFMKKILYIFTFLIILIFSACSSSEETTKESEQSEKPEIYIFDDVTDSQSEPADTSEMVNTPIETIEENNTETGIKFYVQIGAFTTKERADAFVSENSSKVDYPLEISYSENVKLYVVQLPPFTSRSEAEKVRNYYWQSGLFEDAFILTK